ncbi:MAG: hypothetical protein IKO49_05750 [Bacilli bacterium]|nr:hypothetical protein [Bacilli bacterium]
MKKKQDALFFKMVIFFFFIILAFGLIIINEKGNSLKMRKADKIIGKYINSHYQDIRNEIKIGKLVSKDNHFYKKIWNKNNNNLYFIITYKNKKITSTYKNDYLEGTTLIKYIENKLNSDLKKKNTDSNYKNLIITLDLKLNNTNEIIKNRLINEKYTTSIYTISDEKTIMLDSNSINNEIIKLDNYVQKLGFNPKYYELVYNDFSNVTNSIKIKLRCDIIGLNEINIGQEIINNNKSILDKYYIEVKYLN